jgi:HAD superfamily phosphatase (TIGR01681 family)
MLLECYNPNEGNVSMTLTIRSKSSPISFQALIPMQPGFNRLRIGMTDIARSIDASAKFGVELAPNEIADGCTLFFGAMDFVVDAAYAPMEKGVPADSPSNQTASTRFCKCVVWDMDNTLWDGILVEDGSEGIRLKSGIVEILKTLDERGILISAVSKNNQEDAMAALRRFDIVDYFLFRKYPGIPRAMPFSKLRATSILGLIPCCLSMTPPLSVRRSRLSVPMSWC